MRFRRPPRTTRPRREDRPGTFDFLGFTHYWGQSRRGNWVVKRKTVSKRLSQALREITDWCQRHRHQPVRWQQEKLSAKLRGHYGYFGITGNSRAIGAFYWFTCRAWHRALRRRSQKGLRWEKFLRRILKRFPLPQPRIVRGYA